MVGMPADLPTSGEKNSRTSFGSHDVGEETGISWLAHAPLIQLLDDSNARTAYPSRWSEQDSFFGKLTEHLCDMAEFDVNTGLQDQELCALQWAWEHRVAELDGPGRTERTC